MSDKHAAGSIEANGITVPIFVTDHGRWEAEYDGRTQSYETRDKLETRLKTLTRHAAVRVEVAVIKVEKTMGEVKFTRATLTGIHGANGNVLGILHLGGRQGDRREQFGQSYGSRETFFGGDLTDAQLAEYAGLVRAARDAEQAVRKAEQKYEIKNVKEMVQRVIDAASGTGDE